MISLKSKFNSQIIMFVFSQIGLIFALFGTSAGMAQLSSLGVWTVFLSVLINVFSGIKDIRSLSSEKTFTLILVILLILLSTISMLISGEITYQYIVVLFSFLEIPLFIIFTKSCDTEIRINISYIFAIISSIIYIYTFFSPRAHIFFTIYGERTIKDLTLGFSNPNETGMHLTSTLFVLISCIFTVKKKFLKIILFVFSLVNTYFIMLTLSRASIIITIFYYMLIVYFVSKKRIFKWFQISCFFSPIIVLIITSFSADFFSTHHLLGDVIDTGRTSIYLDRITELSWVQVFFGNYEYLFQNSLNAYVSVLVTVGLPSTIVYLYILYQSVKRCDEKAKTTSSIYAFLGILLIFVHGSFESANILSGSFYASSFFSIYILAIDNAKKTYPIE